MTELNFREYRDEIYKIITECKQAILATSADDIVTTRIVSPILKDGMIMISTGINSFKSSQIKKNKNVGISIEHLNIEADATLFGPPSTYNGYIEAYNEKYPEYAKLYETSPEDVLIICKIKKVQLYSYVTFPGKDIIDFTEETAHRINL